MAKSLHALASNVGRFFGITSSPSDDWRSKAERQIKEGEFGLSLKSSVSRHDHEQDKFVQSAEKMLTRISAFQTYDEKLDQTKETGSDIQKSAQVSTSEESEAGCSWDLQDQPLTLTSPKCTKSLGKQLIYNKLYTDKDNEEETGTGHETISKTKVRFDMTSTGSEKSAKSMGYLPKSEALDIEKQSYSNILSDPCVCVKTVALERPKEINKTEQKSEKDELIFFDERTRKPLDRTVFSDNEDDSLHKTRLNFEKSKNSKEAGNADAKIEDGYTVLKEKQEKNRSSPDILSDEVKGYAESHVMEAQTSDVSGRTNLSDKEEEVLEEISNIKDTTKSDASAARDEITDKTSKEKLRPEDVVYGKDALKHYKFYLQIERTVEKRKLMYELQERMQEYDWKLAAIDEMILLAKDYYVNPDTKNASRWKELKRQVKKSSSHKIGHTDVRRKLGALSKYRPLFTYFIILAQLVSFIVICAQNGFTYIGLEPKLTLESDIQTFVGMETVHRWMAPNVWIGPSEKNLIGVGAVFAPCMREDIQLQLDQSRLNYSTDTPLGCCEVTSRNVAGTTTQSECKLLTEGVGTWRGDVTCNKRPVKEAGVRHSMKPCCLGVKGQCRLLSHKHCIFLGGTFYQFGSEHCSQVMCLENVCKPGNLAASKTAPWQPDSPSQWWRVPLSLLYHHGMIEVVFVVAAQWVLLRQIEVVAGWLRMFLIYFISGTTSLLTSGLFLPYQSHVGAVGAVCGMTGVVLVELVHFWRLVHRPFLELAKLLCVIILLLFLGTLPYLDNFGMLTGLIVGTLSGVIFLPYITFGKWHQHVRVALIIGASTLLFVIFYFLVQMFVTVQSVESCESCKVLNCVPYTDKMCDTALWQQF